MVYHGDEGCVALKLYFALKICQQSLTLLDHNQFIKADNYKVILGLSSTNYSQFLWPVSLLFHKMLTIVLLSLCSYSTTHEKRKSDLP